MRFGLDSSPRDNPGEGRFALFAGHGSPAKTNDSVTNTIP